MIPTAETFRWGDEENENWTGTIEDMMIEFAKLHVKAALEAASENAETTHDSAYNVVVDRKSILNSYPLDSIK